MLGIKRLGCSEGISVADTGISVADAEIVGVDVAVSVDS